MTNILHGEISSQDPTPNKGLTIQGIRKGKTTATTEETLSGKRTPALPTPDRPPPQPPPAGECAPKSGDEPTMINYPIPKQKHLLSGRESLTLKTKTATPLDTNTCLPTKNAVAHNAIVR